MVIKRAIERLYFNTLFGSTQTQDIQNHFRMWVNDTPKTAAMYMTNAKGNIILSATKAGYRNIFSDNPDLSSHELFTTTRQNSDLFLYIGSVKHNHDRFITLARKYIDVDGSFGGIIFTLIDPSYFTEFFHNIETSPRSTMLLITETGTILAANEDHTHFHTFFKHELNTRSSIRPDIITTDKVTLEDTLRIYAHKRLETYPIIATVMLDEQDFLATWRRNRLRNIGLLATFAIFGSVISFFALNMARQMRRAENSESRAVTASQAKSEFLANVSHELRTPLNAIIGFSEMLNNSYFGDLNDKQKERVHDINLCGMHLLQLINDILDFSKGEAGKMELQEEVFDLPLVSEECVRIMQERADTKNITLATRLEHSLPRVYADKRKIRQLILNLLSNAVKFTPSGGKVTISAVRMPDDSLRMAITDTGVGMAEGDIPKAMAVFGQVHRDNSHEGTGLGLPLCKMLVELHGGSLHIESALGKGTTVYVTLPPHVCLPTTLWPNEI